MQTVFENNKLLVPQGYYQIFGDTKIKNKDLWYVISWGDWIETGEGNTGQTVEKKQKEHPSIVYIRKISDPTNQTPNFKNGVLIPPDGWRIVEKEEYIEEGDYFYNNNDLNPKFVLTGDGGKGLTNVFVGYFYIRKISFKYIKFANEKPEESGSQITNMQNIDDLKTRLSELEAQKTNLQDRIKKLEEEQTIEAGDFVIALRGSLHAHHRATVYGEKGEAVSEGKIYKVTCLNNNWVSFVNNQGRSDSWDTKYFRKATLSEIEKHLREKATQAGFVIGAKVKWKAADLFIIDSIEFYDKMESIPNLSSAWVSEKNLLIARGKSSNLGFNHSAEICEHLILVKDEVEVNGYKAEYFDKYIKFGCAEIPVQMLIMLKKLYTPKHYKVGNRTLEGKVMIGKGEFTHDIICKLIDNHKEKFGTHE